MVESNAHPLTPERWDDLVTVFGGNDGTGECGRCWCMWWRLPRRGIGEGLGKGNKALFKRRVDVGPPPGLVGYDEAGKPCLLYTSPSPRDGLLSRMPSSA